jgi:hypothetical protein
MKTMIMRRQPFSLTPNFSWVSAMPKLIKPFQRFSAGALETVKTVSPVRRFADTWLKPGVNENCATYATATFQSLTLL